MSGSDNLQGIDLDWFAKDCSGNVALFATAGEGFIPQHVLSTHELHEQVSQAFVTPNWGSKLVWSDYANAGLYVYDWSGNSYKLVAVPNKASATPVQSLAHEALPKFAFTFALTPSITANMLANVA